MFKMTSLDKLHQAMIRSIKEVVGDKKIGIAFSGGVDSSLLAKLCVDLGYKTALLTTGFANSHDVVFSRKVAKIFGYEHKIRKISLKTFPRIASDIKKTIKTNNISWNENCIAFHYVARLAKKCKIKKVLTANGIDELFCGYNAYRDAIKYGENSVKKLMEAKLENEIKMMKTVNDVTSKFGIQIIHPFLSKDFIDLAKSIPVREKIHGPDDMIRKHIIRELALKIDVPEMSSIKRKKALQYGSLIHKFLIKLR